MHRTLTRLARNRLQAVWRDISRPSASRSNGDGDKEMARTKAGEDFDMEKAERSSRVATPDRETTAVCLNCGVLQGVTSYETDVSFTDPSGQVIHLNGEWIECFSCRRTTQAIGLTTHS